MITPQNYQNLGLTDANDITSHIGAGCTVGSIESDEKAILVEGTVKGDILCTGAVIVAVTAKVLGSISAQNALIAGTVESPAGSITIDKTCILHATATVLCDVEAGALETAIGATFEGKISLNRSSERGARQPKPQSTPIAQDTFSAHKHAPAQAITPPTVQEPQPIANAAPSAPEAMTNHADSSHAEALPALTPEEEYAQDIAQIRSSVTAVRNALEQGDEETAKGLLAEIKAIDPEIFKENQLQARVIIADVVEQINQCLENYIPQGPSTPLSLMQGMN